jgi:ferredoxin
MPESRKIIEIDDELCNGCGECIIACAEGALQIVDGKAKLVADIYCDGLGACLGECPQGALKIIERPADAFDEEAVEELLAKQKKQALAEEKLTMPLACGCPSSAEMSMQPAANSEAPLGDAQSRLGHWPVKLQLLNPQAPFLKGADLVLLADCAACALPDLHQRFLNGNAVAMACPKLDDAEAHVAKLAQVLEDARPRSIKVAIMEVPCCKGLDWIAAQALERAGLSIPVETVVIGRDGKLREDREPLQALA